MCFSAVKELHVTRCIIWRCGVASTACAIMLTGCGGMRQDFDSSTVAPCDWRRELEAFELQVFDAPKSGGEAPPIEIDFAEALRERVGDGVIGGTTHALWEVYMTPISAVASELGEGVVSQDAVSRGWRFEITPTGSTFVERDSGDSIAGGAALTNVAAAQSQYAIVVLSQLAQPPSPADGERRDTVLVVLRYAYVHDHWQCVGRHVYPLSK